MLKDKNIVITGSNRGIGAAILRECVQNGANVFACMRTRSEGEEDQLQKLAKEYQVSIYPIYFDLSDEKQIKEGASRILKYKMPISLLFYFLYLVIFQNFVLIFLLMVNTLTLFFLLH